MPSSIGYDLETCEMEPCRETGKEPRSPSRSSTAAKKENSGRVLYEMHSITWCFWFVSNRSSNIFQRKRILSKCPHFMEAHTKSV